MSDDEQRKLDAEKRAYDEEERESPPRSASTSRSRVVRPASTRRASPSGWPSTSAPAASSSRSSRRSSPSSSAASSCSRPATNPLSTYRAIFNGTGLNWLFPWVTGADRTLAAINLQQTLLLTTPLILCGLAVAFAFRCGMFNIGGQGQYIVGSIMAVWVASSFVAHRRAGPHRPLHRRSRRSAARLWAGIAGFLKATIGAHEVISTIMLNWIAIWIGTYFFGLGGPFRPGAGASMPDLERHRRRTRTCPSSGATRCSRASTSASSSRSPRSSSSGRSSTARRSASRCAPSASTRRPPATAASASSGTTSSRWRSPGASPASRARSTSSAGSSRSRHRHPGVVRSASSGSRSRCSAATPRSASFFAALLFGALIVGTSSRQLDPSVFDPDLAGNLTLIIQGLVVLFVGADLLVLSIWQQRRRLRLRRDEAAAKEAASAA